MNSNEYNNKKIRIDFIADIYRMNLINLLKKYNKTNPLEIIDILFSTSLLNEDLKELDNNLFKTNIDIIYFKKILTRIILSDAFVKACSIKYDYEEEDLNEEEIFDLDDDEDMTEIELDIANSIYDYIYNINNISLPEDDDLRINIFALFLDFNSEDKTYDFMNLEIDDNNIKQLKKINPLYKLDKKRL